MSGNIESKREEASALIKVSDQVFTTIWSIRSHSVDPLRSLFIDGTSNFKKKSAALWQDFIRIYKPFVKDEVVERSLENALLGLVGFEKEWEKINRAYRSLVEYNQSLIINAAWSNHAISLTFLKKGDQYLIAYQNRGVCSIDDGCHWHLFECEKPSEDLIKNLIHYEYADQCQAYTESLMKVKIKPQSVKSGLAKHLSVKHLKSFTLKDQHYGDCFYQGFKGGLLSTLFSKHYTGSTTIDDAFVRACGEYKKIKLNTRITLAKQFLRGINVSFDRKSQSYFASMLIKLASKLSTGKTDGYQKLVEQFQDVVSKMEPFTRKRVYTQCYFNRFIRLDGNTKHASYQAMKLFFSVDTPVDQDMLAVLLETYMKDAHEYMPVLESAESTVDSPVAEKTRASISRHRRALSLTDKPHLSVRSLDEAKGCMDVHTWLNQYIRDGWAVDPKGVVFAAMLPRLAMADIVTLVDHHVFETVPLALLSSSAKARILQFMVDHPFSYKVSLGAQAVRLIRQASDDRLRDVMSVKVCSLVENDNESVEVLAELLKYAPGSVIENSPSVFKIIIEEACDRFDNVPITGCFAFLKSKGSSAIKIRDALTLGDSGSVIDLCKLSSEHMKQGLRALFGVSDNAALDLVLDKIKQAVTSVLTTDNPMRHAGLFLTTNPVAAACAGAGGPVRRSVAPDTSPKPGA